MAGNAISGKVTAAKANGDFRGWNTHDFFMV
jgi:hypothetical protein